MTQTAITKRITTIAEAEKQFNLIRTADVNFFTEWRENLVDISDAEKAILDRIKARYREHPDFAKIQFGSASILLA
jgi:hypothetical protein